MRSLQADPRHRKLHLHRDPTLVWRTLSAVARTRRAATVLGPDHPEVWLILELAASVESSARALEVDLDEFDENSLEATLAEASA